MPPSAISNTHRDRSSEIDAGLVLAAIEHMLGRRPVALEGRETLAPRFVWHATFADGSAVYIKGEIPNGVDDALVLEAWAIAQARRAGFPAPEVAAIDTSRAIFPGPLMALTEVAGKPLPVLWRGRQPGEADLDEAQAAHVWHELGEKLRLLHAIQAGGCGRLDDHYYLATGEVRGQQPTWADYALAPAMAALADDAFVAWLPRGLHQASARVFEEHAATFASSEDPRLLHGEICGKHTYVRADGRLSGVIDFGDRESGDRAWEFTNVALWEDDERLDWLIEGYDGEPGLRHRILVYSIADGLRLIYKRFLQGRFEAADPVVAWLVPRVARLAARA